jgi:putative Mg2+ transporter-C (MgtC) family protein
MPFLQKTHGYQPRPSRSRGSSTLLYGRRTPLPIKFFIISLYCCLVLYTLVVLLVEPWIDRGCKEGEVREGEEGKTYANPDYVNSACLWERRESLLYLSKMECDLTRRLLMSVVLGAAIGWERRDSDRPAGIRTMSLVSLGACLFTITSMFSFMSGPMNWDASRVSAAIPSGVGFLGAGLIWKGSVGKGENEVHQVHGLTTAASVWLSAAVGVGAGGGMYFICIYCVALIIIVLR